MAKKGFGYENYNELGVFYRLILDSTFTDLFDF